MNLVDRKGGARSFPLLFYTERNGHAPTFHHSGIDGGLNAEIYAKNCEYIAHSKVRLF